MNVLFRQWWRVGGFFGIAFVVLFIVAIIVQEVASGTPPDFNDPVQEVRAYFEEERQGYLVADYLVWLAFIVLLLPFLVALRGLLGAAEGGGQVFSRTAFAGGLLAIALAGAATASWTALAVGAENFDDSTITALMHLDVAAWNVVGSAFGVLVLAASLVIFATGILGRWLAIYGAIIGVIALISPLWLLDGDPEGVLAILGIVAFLGLALWVLATSISMVLRRVEPAPATPTATETLP
jgi:hypothetical protein